MNLQIFIAANATLREGLKKLDTSAEKVLLVVDEARSLLGTLSDGDLRRGILKGGSLDDTIETLYNPKPEVLYENTFSDEQVRKVLLEKQIALIPVLNSQNKVVEYVTWGAVFSGVGYQHHLPSNRTVDVPVVVMAGGKGTRLAPFTNVLPKPLIPIGEKTILEKIIEEFRHFQIERFLITVNYRGEMIKAYFDGLEKDYTVEYIWEKDFSGTAGSLRLAQKTLPECFIVSNCDVIVKADYSEVLKLHRESGAWLTVISSIQHHKFPYGVIDFKEGGEVWGIREKPEFSFPINTGVYILNRTCLDLIPEGQFFHMTHLIEALLERGHKVLTYPVNEGCYIDIGQWEEYEKAIQQLSKVIP